MTGRLPEDSNAQDLYLLKTIRQAQLDAFWVTEPNTVSKNLGELKRGCKIAHSLGMRHGMFRPMGPFPLEDSFGMGPAVVMLQLLLRAGVNDKHVQFSTIQKMRSAYSNVYHASALSGSGATLACGVKKLKSRIAPPTAIGSLGLVKVAIKGWGISYVWTGPSVLKSWARYSDSWRPSGQT